MRKDASQSHTVYEDGSYVVRKDKKLNILAFILCVVASFFVWIYVMNTQNSNYTKTFSISVEVVNEDALLRDTGLSVFGANKEKANVTIQGKKADVQKYSEKDFRAYIDVSTIDEKGTYPVSVVVETPSVTLSVVSVDPKTVSVYADYLQTKVVSVEPYCVIEGRLDLSAQDTQITISGPQSYLEKISSAKVAVPDANYTVGQMIASSDVSVYDENGAQLSLLYMAIEPSTVTVKVDAINE